MPWFWWLLAILLSLFLLLFIAPVTFYICFVHRREETSLELRIKLWPGLKYQKNFPDLFAVRKEQPESPPRQEAVPATKKTRRKIKKLRRLVKSILPPVLFLLRRAKLHRVRWHTRLGLFDAASTGIATGCLWGVKCFLLSLLYRLSAPLCWPDIAVVPEFRQPFFAGEFAFTISVRLGYILAASVKAAYFYFFKY